MTFTYQSDLVPGEAGAASRAVVLGGSVAGLFAARVLSEVYDEVLVVDRDVLLGVTGPRRGRPQGRHINAMHCRGRLVMEQLFPNITQELIEDGCPSGDMADSVRWFFRGRRLKPFHVGLLAVAATAPTMERHIRDRTNALPNVRFLQRHQVLGLLASDDHSRITGVRLQDLDRAEASAGADSELLLDADLVVDATGRSSRSPVWLAQLGYPTVTEDSTKIGLTYVTQHYRLDGDPFDGDLAIIPVANPQLPRGAIFTKTDGGNAELTVYGLLGDNPPTDQAGFFEFVKTLATPDIYRAVQAAEPVDEPVAFRFPITRRRRYENLDRFPDGLLITGDAVCCFNPVYGQGMTVAALGALTMAEHLQTGAAPDARAYFADLARDVIDPPWQMTNTVDLSFPGVPGRRTLQVRLGQLYLALVQRAATVDGRVTGAYMRAAGMVDRPERLMHPRMVARVVRAAVRSAVRPAA